MEAKKIVVVAIALLAIGSPSIAEFKVKEIGILGDKQHLVQRWKISTNILGFVSYVF